MAFVSSFPALGFGGIAKCGWNLVLRASAGSVSDFPLADEEENYKGEGKLSFPLSGGWLRQKGTILGHWFGLESFWP